MRQKINPLFVLLSSAIILWAASLTSCDSADDELIPSYIRIDSISLKDNSQIYEGSLSHNITDAWLYVNQELIGVFELPARIPVLAEGEVSVTVKAGIKMNGISSTRIPYPFFTEDDMVVTLQKEQTTRLSPEVSYKSDIHLNWYENFEDDNIRLDEFGDTLIIRVQGTDTFEGNGSGKISLNDTNTFYEATTDTSYVLPANGDPVFLEMNFKTNYQVTTGLYALSASMNDQKAIVVLNPTEEWKKIYINLTNAILNSSEASNFRVFFGILRREGDPNATVFVDNLKLIY
jgi:hypothetical protein